MNDGALLSGELRIAGRLDARFFALLRALHDTGSINKAARTAGLSYKGAWLLLETACNLAHEPLLETATGGAGGGGTRLTPAALGLLQASADHYREPCQIAQAPYEGPEGTGTLFTLEKVAT